MKTIIESVRLRLGEMTLDDLDFIAEMIAHPEVMRYYPKLYSRAEAEEWINRQIGRYRSHGYGLWLVTDKSTGEAVGQVGLSPQIVDGVEEPEIGYLIHHSHWRRGLASEAAIAVRDYAFGTLEKDHVISLIRPVNEPSQGVARKMGMRPERKTIYADLEHIVFLLTRDEWERETGRKKQCRK
jgi:RimJ/RimL family protein N-acetyltransferase